MLKERHGGTVTVVALDAPEADDALFTALAKGANRVVKLCGDFASLGSPAAAGLLAGFLKSQNTSLPADALVLLRSQAVDDLAGEIGPFLAEALTAPYVGVVTGVAPGGSGIVVTKELGRGLRGEFTLPLPAVLGIQSAEKPPRYVPIAKVRAAMKSGRIETGKWSQTEAAAQVAVERMYAPEAAGRATMLEGSAEQVSEQIVALLAKRNLI